MIKLQVIGNLGKDAVVNTVNGKTVINFSVAHTEKYKDASGMQQDKTIWVECAFWTDRTAVAPYMKKGTQVHVDGIPEVRNYTTADGRQGSTLSCRVLNVQLLGSKPEGVGSNDGGGYTPQNNTTQPPAPPMQDSNSPVDDLPF